MWTPLLGFPFNISSAKSHTFAIQVWINFKNLYSIHLFYHFIVQKSKVSLSHEKLSFIIFFCAMQSGCVFRSARATWKNVFYS